jgi:26S proteasome regulatory subunit T5
VNKTLPYLVANVIEILDVDPEELGFEEDGANVDLDSQRKGITLNLKLKTLLY